MPLEYAQVLRDLSDRHFPAASRIVLVQDNLSTHKTASLYEAFPPAEARRLVERFEWHYTPRHGSWLDMAEAELRCAVPQGSRLALDHREIVAPIVDGTARQMMRPLDEPRVFADDMSFGNDNDAVWISH